LERSDEESGQAQLNRMQQWLALRFKQILPRFARAGWQGQRTESIDLL